MWPVWRGTEILDWNSAFALVSKVSVFSQTCGEIGMFPVSVF